MTELNKLILLIQSEYEKINNNWHCDISYFPLNMKKIRVNDVYNDDVLLMHIFFYRSFINDNISEMIKKIQQENFSNIVNTRVKAINSIQYKIDNYKLKHEDGKVALKKCLNDLFGIRMIFNDDIEYIKIKEFINNNYPNLKCIKSVKKKYNAVHIYFGNDNNMNFQWELQLWDKKHEKSNLESHAMYKQDYIKWEQENIKVVEIW